MLTFLYVPILDINSTYQMFTHRSCVILFTKITMFLILNKFRILNTTMQVLEMIWMLNELIQANKMVFMNFWFFEHFVACFGDGVDAKMKYFKHNKWIFNVY